MRAFREGEVRVLVATDVAARGLDIPEVDLVVHYRFPDKPETYQHRSRRTGRAGRGGEVILVSQSAHFCAPTPHQDGGLGASATSPTIPKGWA